MNSDPQSAEPSLPDRPPGHGEDRGAGDDGVAVAAAAARRARGQRLLQVAGGVAAGEVAAASDGAEDKGGGAGCGHCPLPPVQLLGQGGRRGPRHR